MTTQEAILNKPLIWSAPAAELTSSLVDLSIKLALTEDLGRGDISSNLCIEAQHNLTATITLKQAAVIAGLDVAAQVFAQVDEKILFEPLLADGSRVIDLPAAAARVSGPARSILSAERTAVNFLQRLSGVATLTAAFVDRVAGSGIKILDTRKTTPGLRVLEKRAVVLGGGVNHRFCLGSAVLIKDNHIAVAGGIGRAVAMVRAGQPEVKIEIEAKTLPEVQEAVQCDVQAIMLDNMPPNMVQEALKTIPRSCFVELSGGINLHNIDQYLIRGVDAISIGALTHSAPSIDISLEVEDHGC